MGILLVTSAMKVRMLHCELKWEIPTKTLALEGGIEIRDREAGNDT